jgi:uncharacterized membrane protein YphA (DoxX/SURF4 family)
MNVALWIVQILLTLAFGMAGLMKITQPKENLAQNMGWVEDFSQDIVRTIGTLELLAAVGMVLPMLTNILPWLTPAAGVGLVLLMVGAALTHLRRQEPQMIVVNLVLLALAAFVAYGRFVLVPVA